MRTVFSVVLFFCVVVSSNEIMTNDKIPVNEPAGEQKFESDKLKTNSLISGLSVSQEIDSISLFTSVNGESDNHIINTADGLAGYGEYDKALLEYSRGLFHTSDDSMKVLFQYKIAQIKSKQGKYVQANDMLTELIDVNSGSGIYVEIIKKCNLRLIENHILEQKYNLASRECDFFLLDYSTGNGFFHESVLLLKEIAFVLSDDLPLGYAFVDKNIDSVYNAYKKTKKRNPFNTLLLSTLIPGAGHLYNNNKTMATISFVTNIPLAIILGERLYAGAISIRDKKRDKAIIAFLDFTIVYSVLFRKYWKGSTNQAGLESARYNKALEDKFRSTILSNYPI